MQWTSNQCPEARAGQEASLLHNLSLYSNSHHSQTTLPRLGCWQWKEIAIQWIKENLSFNVFIFLDFL